MSDVSVRSATLDDAGPLLVIYRPFVLNTAISFELEPPSVAEFRGRIERSLGEWAWLVAERDRRPVGYAYATPHRSRGAYKWSVEPSVYVDEGSHRQGIGKMLYEALLPLLTQKGYCNAYAGITLPNDASVALHRRLGFQAVGVFRSVGRKFGVWHDVSWWHLRLRPEPPHEQLSAQLAHEAVGDVGAVVHGPKRVYVVVADQGPVCKIGEGSLQLHEMLGHSVCKKRAANGDCLSLRNAGLDRDVLYFIFPGTREALFPGLTPENINARIEAIGSKAWQQLLVP